jgi:hypothetical protein
MREVIFIGVMCAIVIIMSCAGERTNQAPEHKAIEQAYFKCERCKSLEGGIYGKGPFKELHRKEAEKCVHAWIRIEKEEFKKLATEWYGVKWEDEIPWWTDEDTGVQGQN